MWDTLIINPMVNILLLIYGVVGNFGLAIILFTICINVLRNEIQSGLAEARKLRKKEQP